MFNVDVYFCVYVLRKRVCFRLVAHLVTQLQRNAMYKITEKSEPRHILSLIDA